MPGWLGRFRPRAVWAVLRESPEEAGSEGRWARQEGLPGWLGSQHCQGPVKEENAGLQAPTLTAALTPACHPQVSGRNRVPRACPCPAEMGTQRSQDVGRAGCPGPPQIQQTWKVPSAVQEQSPGEDPASSAPQRWGPGNPVKGPWSDAAWPVGRGTTGSGLASWGTLAETWEEAIHRVGWPGPPAVSGRLPQNP